MDLETGESVRDKETGELPAPAKINMETGESEINRTRPEHYGNFRKFRIPNAHSLQQSKSHTQEKNKYHISKTAQSLNTSDIVPCILFLLPTTLFFYPIFAACMSIVEIGLHIWAHKKKQKAFK